MQGDCNRSLQTRQLCVLNSFKTLALNTHPHVRVRAHVRFCLMCLRVWDTIGTLESFKGLMDLDEARLSCIA